MADEPNGVSPKTETAGWLPPLVALAAPVAVVFLKGCLLGLAIAGVVALLDAMMGFERL